HAALAGHATGLDIKSVKITAFREGRHPGFPQLGLIDTRPLRLNHAAHMPSQPKTVRGMKLPMKCTDCHSAAAGGDLEPVTFQKHCASCHKRELEFVLPGLPVEAAPAPHTKDAPAIRRFIQESYQNLAAANPSLVTITIHRYVTIVRSC